MNQANIQYDPIDIPHSSGIPEADSLSDSDWLDIASTRESDDNDSVSSTDNEITSMPPSRRSSISNGSSQDGDVEAWEGFASDASDIEEDMPNPESTQSIVLAGPSRRLFLSLEADTAEERRVRDALDQSLISTLSASRSNSHPSTVQNSLRDLRLSFPDPLTSSRDELNRSYEAVSSPSTETESEDVEVPVASEKSEQLQVTIPKTEPMDAKVFDLGPHVDIDIVLYGAPSSAKWAFVYGLLEKAYKIDASYIDTSPSPNGNTRWLTRFASDGKVTFETFAVHDRTDGYLPLSVLVSDFPTVLLPLTSIPFQPSSEQITSDRPSLGIVYLPHQPLRLSEHTFYLPVMLLEDGVAVDTFKQAQDSWDLLAVPTGKVLPVAEDTSRVILGLGAIQRFDSRRVHNAFQCIRANSSISGATIAKRKLLKALALDQFSSVQVVTL